jgi:hypothetical protein
MARRSTPEAQRAARTSYSRALRPLALAGMAIGLLTTLADTDLWGHVRFGLDILRDGFASGPDPYTFTQGKPFTYHEWLGGVIMAVTYRMAGPAGLGLLKAALGAFLLALAWYALRHKTFAWRWGGIAVVAWTSLPFFSTLRPQLWTAIGVALVCRILTMRSGAVWSFPLLFAVWANLHGGWMVGGAVLFIWTVVAWVQRQPDRGRLLLIGAISFVATLLTPYGLELWQYLFETMRQERADLTEWQPIVRNGAGPIALWALGLATVVLSWVKFGRPPAAPLAVLILVGYAAATVTRLVPLFGLAAVMLLSPSWPSEESEGSAASARTFAPLALLVVEMVFVGITLAFAFPVALMPTCVRLSGSPYAPDTRAAEALRGTRGRLVTYFDWGEYALWHFGPALKVSIDGRRETLYTEETVAEQQAIVEGKPAGLAALDRIAADYVWLPSAARTAAQWLSANGYRMEVQTPRSFIAVRADLPALSGRIVNASSGCFPGP